MEENVLQVIPDYKLYRDKSVGAATFLGGPLVAGYMIAENYRALGNINKARNTWIITIITTIVIFSSIYMVPAVQKLQPYVLPIAYTIIAQLIASALQKKAVESHAANGGQFFSIGRVIIVGAVGIAVTIIISYLIMLIFHK